MFNYYHYQPGSNIIIVYGKHIMHTRTHTHTCVRSHPCERVHTNPPHTHTHRLRRIAIRWVCASQPWWPAPLTIADQSLAIEINTVTGGPVSPRFWVFFAYKKLLGRTDTRTRERMYCQMIRTVRDISRDDRARIATCSLRTPTDRQTDRLQGNYSIDVFPVKITFK